MSRKSESKDELDRLTNVRLEELMEVRDVSGLSEAELEKLFVEDKNLLNQAPDGSWAEDPRSGELILFNPARARRPSSFVADRAEVRTIHPSDCPICAGKTTGAVDVARLSEGHTFINKNLYAAVFPHPAGPDEDVPEDQDEAEDESGAPGRMRGLHFLQWTSTLHDKDWHNMPMDDCLIVLRRLAALESTLLNGRRHDSAAAPERSVMIIKNYGVAVGGSLAHGHQQIIAGGRPPRRLRDNAEFEQRHGKVFSEYMLGRNPAELIVRDYEKAVLVVPYFMARPFNMLWILRDHRKRYLHEMDNSELTACAAAWRDAMRAYLRLMPSIGRIPSFNILVHNGPGAGLYCEFLPFTQEYGGFERLGMFVCQSAPESAAQVLQQVFHSLPADSMG